jgi:hypothetical protein
MDSQVAPTPKLVLTDGPADLPAIPDGEAELSFRFDQLLALHPDLQVSPLVMEEHLAHAVAAAPKDLLCHTQRVFFFYGNGDGDGLYSALVDLFIALENKGASLRRRLLNGSRARLSSKQFRVLADWLKRGAPADEKDVSFASQSVLSQGITGVRKLVQVFHTETDAERDPLLEARECIEYFQIEEAKSLLEAAIFEHPEREELHAELIHLYQATRDIANLQAMREKLSQTMTILPDCWLNLEEPTPPRRDQEQ